jgi:peptidylprolyl isomerase
MEERRMPSLTARIGLTAVCSLSLMTAACDPPVARWRPAPVPGATEPSEVIAKSAAADWAPIRDEDLLVMDLSDNSRIVIQLAPHFAPVHVANIRAFARGGWWNNATIYRVQDNYVVQWGNGDANVPLPAGVVQRPPAEYDQPIGGAVTAHASPDAYAPFVGFRDGWPLAWDDREGRAWPIHCYATVGVGRDLAPDTGTGGELYAVIGHAPRHLDRNIANVGRVIEGMPALASRPRGTGNLGFYQTDKGERPIPIARIRVASDMPEAERPRFEYMRTDTETFRRYLTGRANRGGTFFNRPAGGVDICNAPVPVRRRTAL